MCTVTYIPAKEGFYLTSNRDEHQNRGTAISPATYGNLLYPKDPDKSGSWIAAKTNGDVAVLLNGAFAKHIQKPFYKKSRGLLLLEVIANTHPERYFESVDLHDIEPFTLVLCTKGMVCECRWDGAYKYSVQLDPQQPQIWSSATLYDEINQREKFSRFKSANKKDRAAVIDFHRSECLTGPVSTVSITHIQVSYTQVDMTYEDLKTNTTQAKQLDIVRKEISWLNLRIFLIKLFNWEYWPYYVVYTPVMFYWFWLSIKSRAIFFFNTANPGMKNGGFAMDSKYQIYTHIPQYCPKTILIKAGTPVANINVALPLIAKPDIGQRGLQVKLLKSQEDLQTYAANSKVDFLLQEYIDYPKEAGIFYYRMPGSDIVSITGIVGKELMSVTGDGCSTLQELLAKEPRYLLQLPALAKYDYQALQRIIPAGEIALLAPYGNHSRGAKFIDLSDHLTDELVQSVHAVCTQIPGFYYGRLDVKYHTWPELCAGQFKIMEVNGAASEPAHIYDPKHSIFFAWKEIIRHWSILYQVSKQNRRERGLSYMSYREGIDMIRRNTRYVKSANS